MQGKTSPSESMTLWDNQHINHILIEHPNVVHKYCHNASNRNYDDRLNKGLCGEL